MKSFILVFLFSLSLLVESVGARGNEGAYGGDSYGGEFTDLADELIKELALPKYKTLLEENNVSLDLFRQKLRAVVRSAEGEDVKIKVFRNGVEVEEEVDAINYPDDNAIKVNRTRWRMKPLVFKLKDVLHEYFGLMNVERNHFGVSVNFKSVLADLARKMLSSKTSPVRYHGRVAAGIPMNLTGEVCGEHQPHVQEAVRAAKAQAVGHCQEEQGVLCSNRLTEIETIWSTKVRGYIYCEVRTIAK